MNTNLTLNPTRTVFCVLLCSFSPPVSLQQLLNFYHWNWKIHRKIEKKKWRQEIKEVWISSASSALQFTFCIVVQWEMTGNLGSVPGSGNEVQYYSVQAASPLSSTPLVWKTGCLNNKKIIKTGTEIEREKENEKGKRGRTKEEKRKKGKSQPLWHTDIT